MAVTMYHSPRCNTSRRTLALLREKGVEPTIVEYLKTPYTGEQLRKLLGQLKMPASKLVRRKEAAAAGIDCSGASAAASDSVVVSAELSAATVSLAAGAAIAGSTRTGFGGSGGRFSMR